MILVLVAASAAVVRAGLGALAGSSSDVLVTGNAPLNAELWKAIEDGHPEVLLLEAEQNGEEVLGILRNLQLLADGPATVLLSDDAAGPLLKAGARAVLTSGATAGEILAAIQAVAAGLVVLQPGSLDGFSDALTPSRELVSDHLLTAREIEVLRMLSEGLANKEIAYRMGISEHTVKFHVSSLFNKLNASSRTEAVTQGIRRGLILL